MKTNLLVTLSWVALLPACGARGGLFDPSDAAVTESAVPTSCGALRMLMPPTRVLEGRSDAFDNPAIVVRAGQIDLLATAQSHADHQSYLIGRVARIQPDGTLTMGEPHFMTDVESTVQFTRDGDTLVSCRAVFESRTVVERWNTNLEVMGTTSARIRSNLCHSVVNLPGNGMVTMLSRVNPGSSLLRVGRDGLDGAPLPALMGDGVAGSLMDFGGLPLWVSAPHGGGMAMGRVVRGQTPFSTALPDWSGASAPALSAWPFDPNLISVAGFGATSMRAVVRVYDANGARRMESPPLTDLASADGYTALAAMPGTGLVAATLRYGVAAPELGALSLHLLGSHAQILAESDSISTRLVPHFTRGGGVAVAVLGRQIVVHWADKSRESEDSGATMAAVFGCQ